MDIFISWSKNVSKDYAISTKKLLESIDSSIHAFVSEADISPGEDVQKKIIQNVTNWFFALQRIIKNLPGCFLKQDMREDLRKPSFRCFSIRIQTGTRGSTIR